MTLKVFLAILALVLLLAAQQPVAPSQINSVSGNGRTLVTTTGVQTSGNCVTIDSHGNHVASGAGCGSTSPTIASGTAALGTGSISSGACASAVTATATGTLTTDVVTASFNSDPTAVTGYIPSTSGMLTIIAYPTANTANFKVCNNTSSSVTPGAITLNWRVAR